MLAVFTFCGMLVQRPATDLGDSIMNLFTVYKTQPLEQKIVDDLPPAYIAVTGILRRPKNAGGVVPSVDSERDTVFEVRDPQGVVLDYAINNGCGSRSASEARIVAWAHYGRVLHVSAA